MLRERKGKFLCILQFSFILMLNGSEGSTQKIKEIKGIFQIGMQSHIDGHVQYISIHKG